MKHRLTYEVRAEEDVLGGAAVAVRASFPHLHHDVQMIVDPSRFTGPEEVLRLVVNPHRKIGADHDTYDFALEGDLETMEAIGRELLERARAFRAALKKKAGGA